ncbi:MAG: hypothetical protein MUC43_08850 [Pirellula sp.]|jgi:hypothetical protein|nr:hypothetical protein [Pirellula sp.]
MTIVEHEQRRPSSRVRVLGCLGIVAIICGVIVVGISQLRHQVQLSEARSKAEWRQKFFKYVKDGDSSALVMDSKLLPMLATDVDCQKNLTRIDFASTKIDPSDCVYVADLPNVNSMSFYCTIGTKDLLIAARTLPITSLHFEMPDLAMESYLMLKDFPHLKNVRFEHVMDDEWIDRLKSELPNVKIDAPYPRSQEPGGAR